MSGRRGRGKASPVRGRGRGRGRGKAQAKADNESVETNPVSEPHVSEAVDPSTSASDKAATINNTKMNDPVESCIGNLQSTEETLEATLESKEPEVKTKKESDIINIDSDAVSVAVNVTDSSLEPSSNEPEIIELDSDDDDAPPAKMNEERELVSSNVDTKESFGM